MKGAYKSHHRGDHKYIGGSKNEYLSKLCNANGKCGNERK